MLGPLIRILFAITAMAPITISLAYVYAARGQKFLLAGAALVACLALGWLARWVVTSASKRLEVLPVNIKKAKSADKEVMGFVAAYALPLLFRGDGSFEIGAWAVATVLLLFVILTTHTLQVNPILGLFGFHFYEVETADSITYLLISRRQINNIISIKEVVQLTEYGILEPS